MTFAQKLYNDSIVHMDKNWETIFKPAQDRGHMSTAITERQLKIIFGDGLDYAIDWLRSQDVVVLKTRIGTGESDYSTPAVFEDGYLFDWTPKKN